MNVGKPANRGRSIPEIGKNDRAMAEPGFALQLQASFRCGDRKQGCRIMKFTCTCGAHVFDVGTYRGHLISATALDEVLALMDTAIETRSGLQSDAAAMKVRQALAAALTSAWQCRSCGRLYTDSADGRVQGWKPEGPVAPTLFDKP
jgi:hypothetical protein